VADGDVDAAAGAAGCDAARHWHHGRGAALVRMLGDRPAVRRCDGRLSARDGGRVDVPVRGGDLARRRRRRPGTGERRGDPAPGQPGHHDEESGQHGGDGASAGPASRPLHGAESRSSPDGPAHFWMSHRPSDRPMISFCTSVVPP